MRQMPAPLTRLASRIPVAPFSILGPEHEEACRLLRDLNHKYAAARLAWKSHCCRVMSLLTQVNYWLVWADVLLRGGRSVLALQMCLHAIKVAESVQPPFAVWSLLVFGCQSDGL